jgi:hypothetical protein
MAFKKHMMYDPKTGKAYKANKVEDHLRMKKKGYTHTEPKKGHGGPVYNSQGMRVPGMYKKGGSTPAWQRKEGQSPSGGLNAKGRASAKKQGDNLKPPVTESNPTGEKKKRKKSFCARMRGMRKRQKPSNNTGKDRLSLSLKKWNC